MAERRMVSKVISISEKVNCLTLFGRLLYTWMIPHTDDFGRLPGSPAKVRALVVPMGDETTKDVAAALEDMTEKELIIWYEVGGEKIIQISNFEEHQSGLRQRSLSKFPPPPNEKPSEDADGEIDLSNGTLSALESDIEELVTVQLESSQKILTVERQVRIQNSYIDIVATGAESKYIFEVKRQRLSNAALEQIVRYRALMNDPKSSYTLIGYGLAVNFDLQKAKQENVNVVVYDDTLRFEQVLLINVNYRELTLISEKNRTELNRTGTEKNTTATTHANDSNNLQTEDSETQTIHEIHAQVFGKLVMNGLMSGFIKELLDNGCSEEFIKELMLETGESASTPSLRYMQSTAERWIRDGISSREQARLNKQVRNDFRITSSKGPPSDKNKISTRLDNLDRLKKELAVDEPIGSS